jgi:hypothetical protein
MSIRNEKVYDHWRVGIVEEGGNERFVILFVNSAKMEVIRIVGPLTKRKLSSALKAEGLTSTKSEVDDLIRQARAIRLRTMFTVRSSVATSELEICHM